MTPETTGAEELTINVNALEPLFKAWEEPIAHRVRAKDKRGEAQIENGRRPSPIGIVNNLRLSVRDWREMSYPGVSGTTRNLLEHWFQRSHRGATSTGEEFEFRYYFCQREAIETLIFLKEVRGIKCLSQIVSEFGGPDRELAALGITEDEDAISRYCFKLATGTGKTKCMSLAIVWSYFHSLFESESEMARHFVIIAPNLTVYERLMEDFRPERRRREDSWIFDRDPLIPPEWRGDWNMSVVLQSEASGAATGGVIYLTNIHQLYNREKRRKKKESETYDWMGPTVSKAKALDTGAALRDRITAHERVMVLNDEAHHIWDPDSAWNEAIVYLNDTIRKRTGGGLVAQLDFTATPKDNKGNLFKHIVCDTPLGEAVDAGIVKTPIIGSVGKLAEQRSDNAAERYFPHLRLGYERWRKSREEWKKSGKKALLFVMCESTTAADQITQRLNYDETFKELNGLTVNLHTNLKGTVEYVGHGKEKHPVFKESAKDISDDDLKALRKLSRELDDNTSPYHCIVSVLMLREGWDVRNVTTIVPLRPYSSKADILAEQTLGRGLRRMDPSGQVNELVTVVEHPAFSSLYRNELAQEGLPIEEIDIERVPQTTVSIFPDGEHKDIEGLDIQVPRLSAAHRIVPKLEDLTIDDVKRAFGSFKPLPLGSVSDSNLDYEGRHLFTGEVVEQMKIHLPLLESGVGAISYYVKELEHICKVSDTHRLLAPLLEEFFQGILFDRRTTIYDDALVARLSDPDVREHVRAVFVPLIRKRTTQTEKRSVSLEPMRLSTWRPYPVTSSERRPVVQASKTLFNLVPCHQGLEQAMVAFCDRAPDVAAFAKNAGPQCLRIDYFTGGRRLAFYTPDFFVRLPDGRCFLVETKGRQDQDVSIKARAAVAWCKSASTKKTEWEYAYVPQGIFQQFNKNTFLDLVSTCRPSLHGLVNEESEEARHPLFASMEREEEHKAPEAEGIANADLLSKLPSRYRKAAEEAIAIFRFMEKKEGMNYAPVFNALLGPLDEAAKGLLLRRLLEDLPATAVEQRDWFDPDLRQVAPREQEHYKRMAQNLKRTLVFKNGLSPIGLLRNCMDYALKDKKDETEIGGVFKSLSKRFQVSGVRRLFDVVDSMNAFRNQYVAHQGEELRNLNLAQENLSKWIEGLACISEVG